MIGFHRFLISAAIIFCIMIAVWLVTATGGDVGLGRTILAMSFGAAALGLGYYLRHLNRFLHR